jgi:hypothetical protein
MLVAKGYDVELTVDGRVIRPSGALFHDESGRDWPASRCLITTFAKTATPLRRNKFFGPDYDPMRGELNIHGSKSQLLKIACWDEVGDVTRVDYDRLGKHRGAYTHTFATPQRLYRRGKVYCLVMRKTKFNWRGFVDPGQ